MPVLIKNSVAVQSQDAVSAYFTSKQILPLGFAEQNAHFDQFQWLLNATMPT